MYILDIMMFPTDEELATAALLQSQYFPNVKSSDDELPPMFSSHSFTAASAIELEALDDPNLRETRWVEFSTRRYDGMRRHLGLPHPVTYSRLVLHVASNWKNLEPFLGSEQSQIRPIFHGDGRLVTMDYDIPVEALNRDARLASGKRFRVTADISACFPSVYSHALDWAFRGVIVAKSRRHDKCWQTEIDKRTRAVHNGETKGLMIGPAVSNILSEVVLQRVDVQLSNRYSFVRYVDDYTAYCRDRVEAESFLVDLQRLLSTYRLDLNNRKTRIDDLADGMGGDWFYETASHVPEDWTPLRAVRYLRFCESSSRKYPQYSVLKLGVKLALSKRRDQGADPTVLVIDELVRMATFHPHISPYIFAEIVAAGPHIDPEDKARLAIALEDRMLEAVARAESDVVVWHLHTIVEGLGHTPSGEAIAALTSMDDDLVSLTAAKLVTAAVPGVLARALARPYPSESEREAHWLSRYELYRVGLLSAADLSGPELLWMDILRRHSVHFSSLG